MIPAARVFVLFLAVVLSGVAHGQTISLNGDWDFAVDPQRRISVQRLGSTKARTAKVPASWQEQFEDLRDYAGVAWYWRSVQLPQPEKDRVVLLRFGAVDYLAEVFVNGKRAGRNEGGYLPFQFDITGLVRTGQNQVAVRVVDPGKKPDTVEGIAFGEIPHGKQDWYVQNSGLWQEVEIQIRPAARIERLQVSAGADQAFRITAQLSGNAGEVMAEILDPAGRQVWRSTAVSTGKRAEFEGTIANAQLWGLESPTLYTARVSTASGDTQSTTFGFRTFEARDGKFYLNGQVVYLRGALDQDFWPETIYRVPSYEAVKTQMLKAKRLGLNMLRHHIKVPEPAYLRAADETGVLIWYDLPNWDRLTEASKRRGMETLRGMIERDWNHPAIVMLTIINEAWGIDMREASHRAWLRHTFDEVKKIVPPSWLVVDNSPCCDNFHVITDVADFHYYNVIPDNADKFDQFMEDLAKRGEFLFSKHGDAAQTGKEPLVLSEFGNWGLPDIPEKRPFWWARDFRDNPITLPAGVEERFQRYGLGSIFTDLNALVQATQWHQFRALKFEIESIRARAPIQGYVITELTDLNWEANGLMDMWRQEKAYAAEIAKLQQDDIVFAQQMKRNHYGSEPVRVELYGSHYGREPWENVSISWSVEGAEAKGELGVANVPRGSAAPIGTIEFTAPAVQRPERRTLRFEARAGGRVIGDNSWEFYVFPERLVQDAPAIAVHDPKGHLRDLAAALDRRNHKQVQPGGSAVMIATTLDDTVRAELARGGRVLLIATEPQRIGGGVEVVARKDHLEGNWITSFLWMRSQEEPLRALAFEPMATLEVQPVAPATVITGVPPEKFGNVLAGMFYGWIHSNVATLLRARSGKGQLLVTTFSFAKYGSDPYATLLLDELVRYAAAGSESDLEIGAAAKTAAR